MNLAKDIIARTVATVFAIACAFCVQTTYARDYEPKDIENPNIANRYDYIADPEHFVSSETRQKVNYRLQALRDSTTAEVAVAIVPSIGNYSIEDFSEKVFTRWGLGKSDKDNGVLLLISPESRQVRIQTGYGTEGILPDITCAHIIKSAIIPNMSDGCVDCAIDAATAMICKIMSNPEYAEELRSSLADKNRGEIEAPIDTETIITFCLIVVFLFWLISLFAYLYERIQIRKLDSSIKKAHAWRRELTNFAVLSALSAFSALPFYLLALFHYRRARYDGHRCHICGGETTILNTAQAKIHLTPSQQFEVQLGSSEYDVHQCKKCGNTEASEFPTRNTPYQKCPHCGTRAYHFIGKTTLQHPTTRSEGYGTSQFRCEYCGHQDNKGFRIPKKEDMSAALAAGAILGSMGSGKIGGGGGFGGGFGGGSTGGGGASGRW